MYTLPSNVHFAVFCHVKDGDKIRLDKTRKRQTNIQAERQTDRQTHWLIERPIKELANQPNCYAATPMRIQCQFPPRRSTWRYSSEVFVTL